MNRARTTVPFFVTEEEIPRPSTTINRMSPLQEKMEEISLKKPGSLCIQTSFTTGPQGMDFDPSGDSPIVRSQNPLLQSPIPRSQNPTGDSPMNSNNASPRFLDSNGKFVRRASCLSTSTSASSNSRFSPYQ